MFKRISLFSLYFALAMTWAAAQNVVPGVKYPEPVRGLFEKADTEISEYYANPANFSHNEFSGPIEDSIYFRPRVAIPPCDQAEYLRAMVLKAGGTPIDIPGRGSSVIDLRLSAADWDGAVTPEGWVRLEDEYSLLVYKTISDRNIPHIGGSKVTQMIDESLKKDRRRIRSFEKLVDKARAFHRAVRIMDESLALDSHCDLPSEYSRGWSVGTRTDSQVGVPKMDEGHLGSQVLVSFLWQGQNDAASTMRAANRNLNRIASITKDISKYPHLCGLATTPDEADSLRASGKKAFFIAMENGYGLGDDLKIIRKLRSLGVIYISLCHFKDNIFCNTSSRKGNDPSKGLTELGVKAVEEMNRQGIMIDLSHPSAGTFWDCIKYSSAPIICSHSGAKAVYGHDRGLDDDQLRALAENGGVIQIYTVPEYLGRPRNSVTIDDIMKHFNHCVKVAGPEHVGIGSDFDGGGGVWGCNGDNDLINITVKMVEQGYTYDQIKGFWGGNIMRVLREVQAISGRE